LGPLEFLYSVEVEPTGASALLKADGLCTDDVVRACQAEEMMRGVVGCSCKGEGENDVPNPIEEGAAAQDGGFAAPDGSSEPINPLVINF
jgi:hypothetical protein